MPIRYLIVLCCLYDDHVRQHAVRLLGRSRKISKIVDDYSNFGSEFYLKAHWHTILSVKGVWSIY